MTRLLFSVFLAIITAFSFGNNAYADIDLDLDDEPVMQDHKRGGLSLKGGYDMKGEGEIDSEIEIEGFPTEFSDEGDVKNSFSVSLEAVSEVSHTVGFGVGFSFFFARSLDEDFGDYDPQFSSLPIYLLLKLFINTNSSITPYAVGHVGFGLMFFNDDFKEYFLTEDADVSGGLYWGLGAGIMFDNGLLVELLYSAHKGSMEDEGEIYYSGSYYDYEGTLDLKYSKITLSAGVNF